MPDVLFRLDPDNNRYRFLVVELRVPGDRAAAELHLRWGRIGQKGRRKTLPFPMAWDAQKARGTRLKRKEARGYRRTPKGPEEATLAALLQREAEVAREVEVAIDGRPAFDAMRELGHLRRALVAMREAMRWRHEEDDGRQLRLAV